MKLTTKARYAVISVLEMASHDASNPTCLSQISSRQNISLKYLEQIFCKMRKAGLVNAVKGPGGGYVLSRCVSQISVKHVIDAVGEKTDMTGCGNSPFRSCLKTSSKCATHHLWRQLTEKIDNYLGNIAISDLIRDQQQQAQTLCHI